MQLVRSSIAGLLVASVLLCSGVGRAENDTAVTTDAAIDQYEDYNSTLVYCLDYFQVLDDWAAYGMSFEILKAMLTNSASDSESLAAKLMSKAHNLTLLAPSDDVLTMLLADLGLSAQDVTDPKTVEKLVAMLIMVVDPVINPNKLEAHLEVKAGYNVTLITEYNVDYGTSNYTYIDYPGYEGGYYFPAEYNYTDGDYTPDYNYTDYVPSSYYDNLGSDPPLYQITCSSGYVVALQDMDLKALTQTE